MKHLLPLFLLLACTPFLPAQPIELPLNLENAQVARLVIGTHPEATDGLDRKLDIYVPPFGMGTGTAGILLPVKSADMLYQDLRSTTLPQTWSVRCVPAARPIVLTWSPKAIPAGVSVLLRRQNGSLLDMRKVSLLRISAAETISITVSRPAAKPSN